MLVKSCEHSCTEWPVETCAVCKEFSTDRGKLYASCGSANIPAMQRYLTKRRCKHRGEKIALGAMENCAACVERNAFHCKVHGRCTLFVSHMQIECCADCTEFEEWPTPLQTTLGETGSSSNQPTSEPFAGDQ